MIVLSDGQPAGNNYGGQTARSNTRHEVEALRKAGMAVMQVAITNFDSESMFGKWVLRFLDLNDLVSRMRRLIQDVVRKAMDR